MTRHKSIIELGEKIEQMVYIPALAVFAGMSIGFCFIVYQVSMVSLFCFTSDTQGQSVLIYFIILATWIGLVLPEKRINTTGSHKFLIFKHILW